MTDPSVVFRKLTSLRDHAARLRRRRAGDCDAFRGDLDRQDALAMSLLVAVQDAADIALHIASDEGWGVPASYAGGFALLANHGVLEQPLAEKLSALSALSTAPRNWVTNFLGDFGRPRRCARSP
ncbi:MAG: DUF86 domain-containing protein [Planctomycetes bacterium]|nr:DUF86 domain-containing protein [Planctomycetota bacterium]